MLNTVEFKAKIKQGVIEIPEEHLQQLRNENEVQVTVIKQATEAKSKTQIEKDILDYLTENPIKVDGFLERDEIYNGQ